MILLAALLMIATAICTVVVVKLIEPTINQLFLAADMRLLISLPLGVLGIFCIRGFTEYGQSYILRTVGQRVLLDLQLQLYRHLLRGDIDQIYRYKSARLISAFTNDINLMRLAVSDLLVGIAKHLLSVIFLIIMMFKLAPVLAAASFIAFPLAIIPVVHMARVIRKSTYRNQQQLADYTAALDESFQYIKTVKSFLKEDDAYARAKANTEKIFSTYRQIAKFDALVLPVVELIIGLAVAGIIWYGGYQAQHGQANAGALFAFLTAFTSAYRPFKSLLNLNMHLQEGIGAALRVFKILDELPSIVDNPSAIAPQKIIPSIRCHNLSFIINQQTILDDITLELSGGIVALIGPSGSGKTSLINLLSRFYQYQKGEIWLGEHEIQDITMQSLRQQVALATQETALFEASIAANIAYGRTNAEHDDIVAAAKEAEAHDFIMQLPDNYHTIISAQSAQISGGQRQRIAIARVLLKNSPILIFDEATNAIDSATENKIIDNLSAKHRDKLIILVTHRLTVLPKVDHIVMMKNGKIEHQGSYQQLINVLP